MYDNIAVKVESMAEWCAVVGLATMLGKTWRTGGIDYHKDYYEKDGMYLYLNEKILSFGKKYYDTFELYNASEFFNQVIKNYANGVKNPCIKCRDEEMLKGMLGCIEDFVEVVGGKYDEDEYIVFCNSYSGSKYFTVRYSDEYVRQNKRYFSIIGEKIRRNKQETNPIWAS